MVPRERQPYEDRQTQLRMAGDRHKVPCLCRTARAAQTAPDPGLEADSARACHLPPPGGRAKGGDLPAIRLYGALVRVVPSSAILSPLGTALGETEPPPPLSHHQESPTGTSESLLTALRSRGLVFGAAQEDAPHPTEWLGLTDSVVVGGMTNERKEKTGKHQHLTLPHYPSAPGDSGELPDKTLLGGSQNRERKTSKVGKVGRCDP